MNIVPILKNLSVQIKSSSFGSRQKLSTQSIEPSKDTFEKSDSGYLRIINVKNIDGEDLKGYIYENKNLDQYLLVTPESRRFVIKINGKYMGHVDFHDDPNKKCMHIESLYTQENNERCFKGLGTELLKAVVNESEKSGYEGRVELIARHTPPPFVFYYKNNFKPVNKEGRYQAAIDYAARENIPIEKIFPRYRSNIPMKLSKTGAKALLNNSRLYEKNNSETLFKDSYRNFDVVVDWADLGMGYRHNKYSLQIIHNNPNLTEGRQLASIDVNIEKDIDGEYMTFDNYFSSDQSLAEKILLVKAAKMQAKKMGIKDIRFPSQFERAKNSFFY